MSESVIHLRLGLGDCESRGTSSERDREWVSECGWFVSAARSRSLPEWQQVTCKGCKRTRTYKQREAAAALESLRDRLAGTPLTGTGYSEVRDAS